MTIKLIIGLRNPGTHYALTRHNAGAWFVDELVKNYSALAFKVAKKINAELTSFNINNVNCSVLLPLTYMNNSGLAVKTATKFLQVKNDEVLIVHDDLDLAPGRLKFKTGGGHGGHNGVRDIISQLGYADFHRLRIGIGHPQHRGLVLDYVLNKPNLAEKKLIFDAISRGIAAVPVLIAGNSDAAMNLLNSKCDSELL